MDIAAQRLLETYRENLLSNLNGQRGKPGTEAWLELAQKTLEQTIEQEPSTISSLIDEILVDNRYFHGVSGSFGSLGYANREWSGPESMRRYASGHREFDTLFLGSGMDDDFKARVYGDHVKEGYVFKLCFRDRQHDTRKGMHTDYTLFIPNDEVDRVVPVISDHPEMLIELFMRKFPSYDRSEGKLCLESPRRHVNYVPIKSANITGADYGG